MTARWYIIFVHGKEQKVIDNINRLLRKNNLENNVKDLLIITDITKKNLLPHYLFCLCHLTAELVKIFYETPGVVNFFNHRRSETELPVAFPLKNMQTLLALSTNKQKIEAKISPILPFNEKLIFCESDTVEIIDETFKNQQGKILKIEGDILTVKIEVNILGHKVSTSINIPKKNCVLVK